jgi:hypothetical protein
MLPDPNLRRYRNWYAQLLTFYPKAYRDRFAEGMEQTFNDLCRERVKSQASLFTFALWTLIETSAAIIRENAKSMSRWSMKQSSTLFFKLVISLTALAAVAIGFFALPTIVGHEAIKQKPGTELIPIIFLTCAYILSIPFFIGLYQAFKLLTYIDLNKFISDVSARALRTLKNSAISISVMMVAGIVALMILSRGKGEDITGVIAPALLVTIASGVVATVAAVLQRRVQKAIH